MKEKRDCKIVQDLLPNYIEKLTNEETNKFIEEHLKECDECQKVLENMQKNLNITTTNKDKKAVKYFKKYRKKLRILRIILLIILTIFIVNTARKMIIIQSMQNKIMQYERVDNFYIKSYYYQGDIIYFSEIYNKGNKYKAKNSNLWFADNNTRLEIFEVYGNEENENWYRIDNYNDKDKAKKTATLNKDGSSKTLKRILGMSNFETNNFWELLLMAISSDISSESCNGKECYRISYTFFTVCPTTPILWQQEHYMQIYYLEKETGLPIRSINNRDVEINHGNKEQTLDFEYDFGNVTDDDIKEPNINEYEIIE